MVGVVENGSAEKAGIKEGDVILSIGAKEVNSSLPCKKRSKNETR